MLIVRRIMLLVVVMLLGLTLTPAPASPMDTCPEQANCMCYVAGVERTPPDQRSGPFGFKLKEKCVYVPTP